MILGFVLFLFFLLVLLLVITGSSDKCITDISSPLNFIMFQEPRNKYSSQLVNIWVDKKWTDDGDRIPCYLEKHESGNDNKEADRTLIIYSHGNGENLLNCTQFSRELASKLQADVLSYEYSGYGINKYNKFERSAEGITLTLKTVFDYMVTNKMYKSSNIILWGYSLGSGPSLELAANLSKTVQSVKGVVLLGAFTNIKDVIRQNTHNKIAEMFSERWDNLASIRKVSCPILLLHGEHDTFIPASHSTQLKNATTNAKLQILPSANHANFNWDSIIEQVSQWLTNTHF
jgi:fermentation-respiration switch protein FrsA (DUF1100 family)